MSEMEMAQPKPEPKPPNKHWYQSKTIWVNTIAAAALLIQSGTGFVIDPQGQAAIIVVLNLILRALTREPLGK